LKEEHDKRIERAIEGYSIRPHVEADFNRVIKPTESLISRKKTTYDKVKKSFSSLID